MIGQALHRLWIDIKTDAERFWFHLKHVVAHPWDSLLALLAAIGAVVLAIPRYIGKFFLWLWRLIKYVETITLRGLVRLLIFAVLACCLSYLSLHRDPGSLSGHAAAQFSKRRSAHLSQ